MNTKLSFAILRKHELEELKQLINQLTSVKWTHEIEIVLLSDGDDTTCYEYFKEKQQSITLTYDNVYMYVYQRKLDNFSNQKNHLFSLCNGEWIYNLDADELLTNYMLNENELMNMLFQMKKASIQMAWVPRINIVEGITDEYIKKWNWTVNEKGYINFPDKQSRIIFNQPLRCTWKGIVREQLIIDPNTKLQNVLYLPEEDRYCIIHKKHIDKQISQNNLYEKMMTNGHII